MKFNDISSCFYKVLFILVLWCITYYSLTYFDLWHFFGIPKMVIIFPDLHVLLTAIDGYHQGIDVLKSNPLCYLSIPHVYSCSWFLLHHVGFSDDYRIFIGVIIIVLFAVSITELVKYKFLYFLPLILSPTLIFTIERCNNDLIIFIMLWFTGFFALSDSRKKIFFSHILLITAVSFKYYPIAFSLIYLFRKENLTSNLKHILTQALFFMIWISFVWEDLQFQQLTIPNPGYSFSFGFETFNTLCSNLLHLNVNVSFFVNSLIILFFVLSLSKFYAKNLICTKAKDTQKRLKVSLCFGGTMVLLFCYFVRTSFDYRMIFIFFILPTFLDFKFFTLKKISHFFLSPIFIYFLFLISIWIEAFREWFLLVFKAYGYDNFIPQLLFSLRAFEQCINHFSFLSTLAFSLFLICSCNKDIQNIISKFTTTKTK